MASIREIRKKFKGFFPLNKASDNGVELLERFIYPFIKALPQRSPSIESVLTMFFAAEDRVFFYLRALRGFELPAKLFIAGNRTTHDYKKVRIKKNQVLMAILDRRDQTVKIEIIDEEERKNFLLEKFEFETMKDWVEVINGQDNSFGLGDNRPRSVARRDPDRRYIRRRSVQSTDEDV